MCWGQKQKIDAIITKWYTVKDVENNQVQMIKDGEIVLPRDGQLFCNPHMAKVDHKTRNHRQTDLMFVVMNEI